MLNKIKELIVIMVIVFIITTMVVTLYNGLSKNFNNYKATVNGFTSITPDGEQVVCNKQTWVSKDSSLVHCIGLTQGCNIIEGHGMLSTVTTMNCMPLKKEE